MNKCDAEFGRHRGKANIDHAAVRREEQMMRDVFGEAYAPAPPVPNASSGGVLATSGRRPIILGSGGPFGECRQLDTSVKSPWAASSRQG
jgi:hypothetical protein